MFVDKPITLKLIYASAHIYKQNTKQPNINNQQLPKSSIMWN